MSGMPGPWSSNASRRPARLPSASRLEAHLAAAAVVERVARQLARRGHDLGLVDQAEAERDRALAHRLAHAHDVLRRADRRAQCSPRSPAFSLALVLERARPGPARRSQAMPFSTLSAVCTPSSDRPSSTSVIATAGCMPTTTVCASSTRAIAAMLASMRPMKESTTSSAEMSISTPRARSLDDAGGQVVLQRHRELVVHVHLDGDQQELAHLQDRDALHQPAPSRLRRRRSRA